jgi:hypothetical protein
MLDKIKKKLNKDSEEGKDWFDEPNDPYSDYDYVETDNRRWQYMYDDVLSDLRHKLKHEVRNQKGEWVMLPGTKPTMNDAGIAMYLHQLGLVLNKVNPLSVWDAKKVDIFSKMYSIEMYYILKYNEKDYGIEEDLIEGIIYGFFLNVRSLLSKAINDGQRKIDAKMFSHKEQYNHDEVSADEIGRATL